MRSQVHSSPSISTLYRSEPGSPIHALKVHMILQCPLVSICSLANEVEQIPRCLGPAAKSTNLSISRVAQLSRYSMLVRFFCHMYWPLGRRDLVLDGQGIDSLDEGSISIVARPVPQTVDEFHRTFQGTAAESSFLPPVPGTKRMILHPSGGIMRALGPNATLVSSTFSLDPCISFIPTSLINYTTRTLAHVIIQQVQKQVESFEASIFAVRIRFNRQFYKDIEQRCEAMWRAAAAATVIPHGNENGEDRDQNKTNQSENVYRQSLENNLRHALLALPGNMQLHLRRLDSMIRFVDTMKMYTQGGRLGFGSGWSNIPILFHKTQGLVFLSSRAVERFHDTVDDYSRQFMEQEASIVTKDHQKKIDALKRDLDKNLLTELQTLGWPSFDIDTKVERSRHITYCVSAFILKAETISCRLVSMEVEKQVDRSLLSAHQIPPTGFHVYPRSEDYLAGQDGSSGSASQRESGRDDFEASDGTDEESDADNNNDNRNSKIKLRYEKDVQSAEEDEIESANLISCALTQYEPEVIWVVTEKLAKRLEAIYLAITDYNLYVRPVKEGEIDSALSEQFTAQKLYTIKLKFNLVSAAKAFVLEMASLGGLDVFKTGILHYVDAAEAVAL